MRLTLRWWCCWALACGSGLAAQAQTATSDPLVQARELARAGRHAEAIPIYEQQLADLEQRDGPDSESLIYLLHEIAVQHHAVGATETAEPLYQRALDLAELHHGDRDSSLVPSLRGLAAVAAMRGLWDQAESYHRRVLDIQESSNATKPGIARTLAELGLLEQLRGDPDQAEEYYRRALESSDAEVLTDTEVATVAGNLAAIYARQERYAESEATYRRVLAVRERQLGPNHVDLVKVLLELASLQFRQRRYSAAASSYERALRLREQVGENDLALSEILGQLAATYFQLGRSAEAAAHFTMAKTILDAQCAGRERSKACRDVAAVHAGLENRPRDLGAPATGAPAEEAPTRVAEPVEPAPPPPRAHKARRLYRSQVAARQDRQQAVEILDRLLAAHPDLLFVLATHVVEVDLAERGIWHRVQIGDHESRREAKALCAELKKGGVDDCWVVAVEEP